MSAATITELPKPKPPPTNDTWKLVGAVMVTFEEAVNPAAVKVKVCSVAADPYVAVKAVIEPDGVIL